MRRRILALLLFVAIGLAAGLASSPQLHNWLHDAGDSGQHECAATLMSSGNIEHSDCAPPAVAPQPAPSVPAFRTQLFPRVLAFFGFARLEHAPPATR
jgi:hypothetical protein